MIFHSKVHGELYRYASCCVRVVSDVIAAGCITEYMLSTLVESINTCLSIKGVSGKGANISYFKIYNTF